MTQPAPTYATLDEWIARTALTLPFDVPQGFDEAVDALIAALGESVELLGLGEPLHGGREFLFFRNRFFQRLVEAHGYSAIAVESSFPRGWLVDDYIGGRGPTTYEDVQKAGFSHGFGRLEANRELVEWMRRYNADARGRTPLRFYGFDSPTEMTSTESPRRLLSYVLDYLASVGSDDAERRGRIEMWLGDDADWENPEAMYDSDKSIGLSPAATALRAETEDLLTELATRRPELGSGDGADAYGKAVRHAELARELLNYHAILARPSDSTQRLIDGLGLRDVMMAANLQYILSRERGRGKVLVFAHNGHVQRGPMHWQLGSHDLTWWPAGTHLSMTLGARYRVIGMGLVAAEQLGIGRPEERTLEARLAGVPGPIRAVLTQRGEGLPTAEVDALAPRTTTHPGYFPFRRASLADFDVLAVFDAVTMDSGAPRL